MAGPRCFNFRQCKITIVSFPSLTTILTNNESIWVRTNIYCTYEILVTGPLCTSECAGECRLSANLCKRALDVTADVIVEATRNADKLS